VNRKKLLAILAALSLAWPSACSAKRTPGVVCTYAVNPTEIPNPAFWAITEHAGAQLIEPGSELFKLITGKLGSVETHSVVQTGDILVATKASFLIDPEVLGVDRGAIKDCQPSDKKEGTVSRLLRIG
jgi:hypothetical protein